MSNRSVVEQGFQIVAHRGYRARICENTLPAFIAALNAGATMLELDVRLSSDGEAVLLHDATMQRLAGDSRSVSKLAWSDLNDMAIHDKKADTYPDGRIARLEELFTTIGNRCNYCVELKFSPKEPLTYHEALCEITCSLIEHHKLTDRCLFVCTEVALLKWLHGRLPDVPVGWVFEQEQQIGSLADLKAMKALLCPRMGLLDEQNVADFKRAGFSLMPWTANRPAEMRRLLNWGVVGITTDEVETLVEVYHGTL